MNKTLEEKAHRAQEIVADIHRLEEELADLFDQHVGKVPDASGMLPFTPRGEAKPCCGSKGSRHKKGCDAAGKKAKAPPGEKIYQCTDCDAVFSSPLDYIDVVCARCRGTHCIQKH